MKRCPQCDRFETDESLKFCRVDGATLIVESASLNTEAGTAQLGSSPHASEVHTSILPHNTNANVNRMTSPTTVLPRQSAPATTNELTKPKGRRMAGIVAVVLMAVVVAVSAVLVNSYRSKRSAATIQAIAVMPFVNEGGNADLEYLSDGMTETLIGDLSQLPNLSVKARSSVFRYKGKDANAQTIGKELNVQAILNGRIIQHGDQLDLNMELVDAATENVLWTQHGINFYKAVCLAVSGRRDEAVQQFKRIQEMDPTFPWAHSFLARVYVWMGNRAAAVEERAKALELNGKPEDAKLIRESFAKAGWDGFLREGARQGREPFFKLALLSNANDADKEAMVKALTEGVERGGFWLFLIKTDPLYDPLRGDPRFQELLKKFNPPK